MGETHPSGSITGSTGSGSQTLSYAMHVVYPFPTSFLRKVCAPDILSDLWHRTDNFKTVRITWPDSHGTGFLRAPCAVIRMDHHILIHDTAPRKSYQCPAQGA
jgi:hypothetical protein